MKIDLFDTDGNNHRYELNYLLGEARKLLKDHPLLEREERDKCTANLDYILRTIGTK